MTKDVQRSEGSGNPQKGILLTKGKKKKKKGPENRVITVW